MKRHYRVRADEDNGFVPFAEIAAELGVTYQCVQQTYDRALFKALLACRRYGIKPSDVLGYYPAPAGGKEG